MTTQRLALISISIMAFLWPRNARTQERGFFGSSSPVLRINAPSSFDSTPFLSHDGTTVFASTYGLHARVIPVRLDGTGEHRDIQAALDEAEDGDTVLVGRGEYRLSEALNFNRDFNPENLEGLPPKNLILRSEDGRAVTELVTERSNRPPEHGSVIVFNSGESDQSLHDQRES